MHKNFLSCAKKYASAHDVSLAQGIIHLSEDRPSEATQWACSIGLPDIQEDFNCDFEELVCIYVKKIKCSYGDALELASLSWPHSYAEHLSKGVELLVELEKSPFEQEMDRQRRHLACARDHQRVNGGTLTSALSATVHNY